ncbi:MAG: N-acetylneuraminate synthase [Verrucomicrobiaceae bacterium]|nr:MAG: N-acetylneuraminate synthase [Verrucomicrobiaceae bacterium]
MSNISPKRKTRIIAEIGCNHKGDMEIAKELIKVAAHVCGADVAKFQKRNPKELLSENQYNSPHPNPVHSYGATYGEHRQFLEFSLEQHVELKAYCESQGIVYATSVWDLVSAKEIASLNPELIKIPSATNLNFELQDYLCTNYSGKIHVSTGMTKRDEIDTVIDFYEQRGRAKDLVVYACTSGYPVAFEELCLREITTLIEKYADRVDQIGFSGHHLGIAADVAAMTLGAEWIERHFTLDRTWKGTDHSASLEPDGLRRLCRDIRHVEAALTYKEVDILDVELVQRKKLKPSPEESLA